MKRKFFCFLLVIALFSTFLPGVTYAAQDQPFTLAAPTNLRAELKFEEGVPYFELTLDVPQSVIDINNKIIEDPLCYAGYQCCEIEIQFDFRYGDYDWNEGESLYWTTSAYLEEFVDDKTFDYFPLGEEYADGSINIEEEVYEFRAYFYCLYGYVDDWVDKTVQSGYSNIVTIGNPAYYKGASNWAIAEMDRALKYGFITDKIRDNLSAEITREEFAEVAVKVYEKYTGKEATYKDMTAFTDTKNPEIFKAFELKIVNGVGDNKFAPNNKITREQMAAMLYRLIEAIEPETDFSTNGAPVFSDESSIANYAKEYVKYMSKHEFIKGVGENRFAPKTTCKREMAVAVAVRVYEKFADLK